jgi:hypothetical protein
MLDLLYDLSPDEGIACVEGHLLVLLKEDDQLSSAVADLLERRVAQLDDTSEFLLAAASAELFPDLRARAQDFPALFHFLDGKSRSTHHGADDCVEFFEEFVIANRCKRNGKRR